MMTGRVNSDIEAILALTVIGPSGQQLQVEAILDTGFSGFLTLPLNLITSLALTWLGREEGLLADGNAVLFDVYRGTVVWNGQPRVVEVEDTDTAPLLGMAMVAGHEVRFEAVDGGALAIAPLP